MLLSYINSHLYIFCNSDESPPSRWSKQGVLDAHLWVPTWLYLGIKFGKWGNSLCTYIKSSQTSFYSKCRKHLEAIRWYSEGKVDYYNERLDEGADTDSQDERDHGVWPTDPNVMSYKKKKWGGCYHVIMEVVSMVMHFPWRNNFEVGCGQWVLLR